jgi:hypothetical protein
LNHGLFAPIEKIKKYAKNLQSTNFSPSIPTSPPHLTSFLSKREANRFSFDSRKNNSFGSKKFDKSKYANAFEPTTNKSLTYQQSSHFDNENKLVESIQSNLEKINSLKLNLEKEIIKYNHHQHASNITTLCITKANNKLLKTSANTIRSKSTPQKLLNSEKRRKLFAKSNQNDIYKSLLLSQQSKMILNQLNADKNATNPSGNVSGSSSSALNNFKNLITYSSSSSTSNSSSTSTSTSTSINYSGKKPVDSAGKKSSLLSLKNFHLKIPKFNNSSNNGTSSAENSKSITTHPSVNTNVGATCANSAEKVSSNLELPKSKDLTGMCRQ